MSIGCKLYRTTVCADSIEWAKQYITDAPDGAVFIADKLTKAKGRSGRIWEVYDGQLLITLLLKPKILQNFSIEDLPIRINQLNMAISLGINEVLAEYGIGIKWPNDFIVKGKKVGGVLFHLVWRNNLPIGIVCGFAVNVNNLFKESDKLFKVAISLAQLSGKRIEMRPLYRKLLNSIDDYYQKWIFGNFNEIYKLWRDAQVCLGKQLTVHKVGGQLISGEMIQVLPNGDMFMVDRFNKQKIISFYIVEQINLDK